MVELCVVSTQVYRAVWQLIRDGDVAGLEKYMAATAPRDFEGAAKQRATDVVVLYRDAARIKPQFDATVGRIVGGLKASRSPSRRA